MDSVVLGQAVTVLVFVAFHTANRLAGKKKDEKNDEKLDLRFASLHSSNEQSFTEIRADIAEVRAFCVGPDGENGFRQDLKETKTRVIELEKRERQRLEDQVGIADRRRTS